MDKTSKNSQAEVDIHHQNFVSDLSQYGLVQVCADKSVLTILLTKEEKSLAQSTTVLEIMKKAVDYTGGKKSVIGVMRNDEDFLLLVLKDNVPQNPYTDARD